MCSQVPSSGISSNNWIKLTRAFLNQYHKSSSNSYANQQADYEDEYGEKISLLALWIKSHTGKDGFFLSGIDTNDFVLRLKYPTKSQLELYNEAFEEIMYQDEIPDHLVGYGLGEKEKLKDQVQKNNFLFRTLIRQFSQVVSAVHQEKPSPEHLKCTHELLGMAHQQ
ncbi:hypothetical protein RDABS01_002470, partial [Bienertia sinuspersici]